MRELKNKQMWWDEGYDPNVDDPLKDLITPSTLNPEGECYGDGLHTGYCCMCDGCEYQLECCERTEQKTIPELCEDYANVCNELLKEPYNEKLNTEKRILEEKIAIWRMETLFWGKNENGEWEYKWPGKKR